MLQQGLLLLFIEILDLVEIQENATDAREGVELLHHRLDIGGGRGGPVELVQPHIGPPGDDPGQSGLAHPGRAVKNKVRDMPRLDNGAQGLARRDQMLLADDIVQGIRTHPVGERRRHTHLHPFTRG